ncbi:MAG TPA: hypothetical protein VKP88_07900 [Candidatus Paceibacterota bacterium]|nr:hypothetical protein [Candidatus Paceibacterota bacterium]
MDLLFIGMTLSVVGKGMLALGVVWVHIAMANERSIDDLVVRSFRTELYVTLLGFALIVAGYIIEVLALGGFMTMATCVGPECAAAVIQSLTE